MTGRRPARLVGGLVGTAVLAAGCGSASAPADEVPALAERLGRIDRAVGSGDEAAIREQVESLIDATEAAHGSGRLDDDQAGRVLAAADALLARLPSEEAPEPAPSATTTSPPPEQPAPPPEDGEEDEDEDDDEGRGEGRGEEKSEAEKKAEEAQKKAEEERKKAEEEKKKEE